MLLSSAKGVRYEPVVVITLVFQLSVTKPN